MGQIKKSRAGKGRAGRMPSTPMMREIHNDIGIKLHAAVETLIESPSIDAYNTVSINLMTFGRAFGKRVEIERLKQAMIDIYARYERVGRIGVNADEANTLRAGASFIDAMLPLLSLEQWALADILTAAQVSNPAYQPIERPTEQEAA